MKKIYSSILVFLFFHNILFAQDDTFNQSDVKESLNAKTENSVPDSLRHWKTGAIFNTNFTNTSLSNWAAGGQNALTISTLLNAYANYKNNNHYWNNYLELGFGLTKLGNASAPFRKGDDKIIFTSRYGRNITNVLNVTGLLDFRTQFTNGYKFGTDDITKLETKTYISNFLAPAYVVASIGLEYKPNDAFFVVVSPLTSKMTIVNDDTLSAKGAFGVEVGKKLRSEFGSYLNSGFKVKIMKNIAYQSTANLFMNYKTVNKIDVFWDNLITLTVNKYINTTFSWVMIYDDDIKVKRDNGTIGPSLQMKSVLAVGVNVKLIK